MLRSAMCWSIILLGIVATLRVSAQEAVSLAGVQALRKPVTLRNKMILLPELLREVSRQTGVVLTAGRELAGDKLTVFVKEVPASNLLERVATIVMGEWHKTKDGYMLAQTAQAQRWEQELLALERENCLQDARQMVDAYMRHAQRPYTEVVREARQRYEAMMAGRPKDVLQLPGGGTMQMVGPVWLPGNLDYAELPYYLIGRLLRGFSREQWQAFWRGEPVVASTLSLPGVLPLPEDALQWDRESVQLKLPLGDDEAERRLREMLLAQAERDPTRHIILVFALDERAGTIRSAIYRFKSAGIEPYGSLGGVVTSVMREPKRRVQEHPCFQWWSRWQTGEEEATKATALQAKVNPTQGERLPPSEYVSQPGQIRPYFALADYLEWLARRVDLQIVADAYRFAWNRSTDLPFVVAGETVGEWLKRMMRPADEYGGGWWRVEDEWLLVKHGRFWDLRRSELPEQLVRDLERKVARGQSLTLNDYAALAKQMGTEHRYRLEMLDGYTVRFSLLPLNGHLPMLRFWASLNGAQQAAALRDGVLPVASLSRSQQQVYWRSAWEGVLFGTFYAKQWALTQGDDAVPLPAFAIAVAPMEKYQLVGTGMSAPIVDTPEQAEVLAEDMRRWQPNTEVTIRPVQVVQCQYEFLLFPNLRYTGRFDIVSPGR